MRTGLNSLMQYAGNSESTASFAAVETPLTPNEIAPTTSENTAPSTVSEPLSVPNAEPLTQRQAASNATTPIAEARAASVRPATVDIDTDFSSPTASKRTLKKVAETILASEPSAALSYRIHRYLTWCEMDGLPDHKDNVTPLMLAVSQDLQAEYRDKAKQGSDVDTVKRLEKTLTDAPFWLTGHYLVFQMLENLNYSDAAQAVADEARRFVDNLSGFEKLTFKNSVPFADEATQQWLAASTSSLPLTNVGLTTVLLQDSGDEQMDDIALENIGEHMAKIALKLEADRSGRGQFLLQIKMIDALNRVGLHSLSLPYLEKVWTVSQEMKLADWEPQLHVKMSALLNTSLKTLYPKKEQLPVNYQEWQPLY
ncbi:type VI secretion-associated protein, VC_A0119 family [Enterovibrio nigricans DSM 22720]|uniref:Type VI secretion-associated protein, VC_A0119 family n=1 Tax=Enterovibrio nigricans DSM 22720 TaxID=1121868 RepID=A0A1T4VAB9_9GAMM|nr:type VI secretion-associated protein, VC_A0119 family [Enterovibrio nigricans DSM 22720]